MNKFSKLNFPIFGLKTVVDFNFTLNEIFTTINGQKYIVDDKSINNPSYLSRLVELDSRKKYQRLKFDYTIRNMEELLKSDCKVGIDELGNIRYFDVKEQFKYSERKIVKNRNKHFWFDKISYPFTLDLENIEKIAEDYKYYYGKLTYINRNWYFLGFSDEKGTKDKIWI